MNNIVVVVYREIEYREDPVSWYNIIYATNLLQQEYFISMIFFNILNPMNSIKVWNEWMVILLIFPIPFQIFYWILIFNKITYIKVTCFELRDNLFP